MTIEEAKALISQDNVDRLKNVVSPKPSVSISTKTNMDIIMSALCTAVSNGVIKESSLDMSIIKLLNSSTSTGSSRRSPK